MVHFAVDKLHGALASQPTCVYGLASMAGAYPSDSGSGGQIMLDVAARPATKVNTNHGRQQRLVRIISELSLLRSGQIRLAAGGTSTFYFDMKPTLFCPEGAALVAEWVLDFAAQEGAQFVGGLEIGAVPIVACVSQLSFLRGRPRVQGFFVRKAPKDHGTRKRIEGLSPEVLSGSRALIVDDVTTTGSSVLQAVEVARSEGAIIGTVLTVVDRLEGAATNLAKHGINLVPLTTAAHYGL
jgi:orotate phosphoribosyltransferase